MTAQANLVAFDGASTPISHTLVGESVVRENDGTITARWKESLVGVPDYAQVRHTQTRRKLPSGVWRSTARSEFPVMESISGQNASGYTAAPKVAYTDTMESTGFNHERSTVAGRRTVRQFHINVLGNVTTSVAPITTGPAPELFDQLLMVS
jgi:hypothetical protein